MSLLDSLVSTVKSLTELKVITAVGDVNIAVTNLKKGSDAEIQLAPTNDKNDLKGIYTKVNLVTADTTNLIDKSFVDASGQAMRDFHNSQVTNAKDLIASNIESVKKLAEIAGTEIKDLLMKDDDPKKDNKTPEPANPQVNDDTQDNH